MNFDSFPQVACLMLPVFGLLCFAVGVYDFWGAWRSRSWPATEGEIVYSWAVNVFRVTGANNEGPGSRLGIGYEYTLNGVRYEGRRAYFGGEPTLRVARNIVAKFPAKAVVKVYYYPERPGTSVLIPGFNRFTYGGLILALLFFSLTAWLWQYR
ncbi:DUF3592 domain-containing protein [Undibacterium sp. Di27W]|uniref:DUF3592 domain-containing protein n=1 Tax=Undibacterium sp. Di27W TaxID=3413036 RepID=UPI003BEFE6EB